MMINSLMCAYTTLQFPPYLPLLEKAKWNMMYSGVDITFLTGAPIFGSIGGPKSASGGLKRLSGALTLLSARGSMRIAEPPEIIVALRNPEK